MLDTTEFNLDDYFEVRSANEWLRAAKPVPMPKKLFGELWFQGEIAIMFGDTGIGKSALAVQIAEAVARGKGWVSANMPCGDLLTTPSAEAAATPPKTGGESEVLLHSLSKEGWTPLWADGVVRSPAMPTNANTTFGAVTARPQPVLYLDFELSAKQFEMRYAEEPDEDGVEYFDNHYEFSEQLTRVSVRPDVFRQNGDMPFESAIRRMIEPLIERTGARVLIVDNITYLKRTADNSRDSAPLMKELKRLKEQFGLSILVIAHTPKRDIKRPVVLNDLQGSKVIANFADSVFAIGQCRREPNERYIKHVKQRSSEMLHGRDALPVFRMGKIGGNFLGLKFQRFASEAEMLRESCFSHTWAIIQKVKDLSDSGNSIREIAEQLNLSKSAAHRYLQMWHPNIAPYAGEPAEPVIHYGEPGHESWFPGREEYTSAANDPRFDNCYTTDTIEDRFLRRETYLIESALAEARTQYQKTGTAPKLHENETYTDFINAVRTYKESSAQTITEPIAHILNSPPVLGGVAPASGDGVVDSDSDSNIPNSPPCLGGVAAASADGVVDPPTNQNPVTTVPGSDKSPLDQLELDINDRGTRRYVESRYENGKLRVWYQYRSDGQLLRWEHNGGGSISRNADPEVFGSAVQR